MLLKTSSSQTELFDDWKYQNGKDQNRHVTVDNLAQTQSEL